MNISAKTNVSSETASDTEIRSTRAQRFSWCLFDFANSAFPTVIITAIYILYFKDVVVGADRVGESDRLWGMANAIGAAVVFLIAPVLGAIADRSGKRKHFLIGFSLLCIVSTALLSFTGQGTVSLAMGAFIAALVGFEASLVFYNSFLPNLVPPSQMDRLSGAGWALGYLGGLGCLVICLQIVQVGGLLHLIPMVVAVWFAVFAIPAFLQLRDRRSDHALSAADAIAQGITQLLGTFREIKKHGNLLKFLAAFFFYNNAVATIIVFAAGFAKDSLAFSMEENIKLILMMNIVAAPGAYFFGWIAQHQGGRKTIIITLFMWIGVVAGAELAAWPGLFTASGAKICFWGVAALASLCIGATQATSRAFVGQLAPRGQSGEFFGFMAFAGKGSAILGPLVFGLVSDSFNSQRMAVLSIGFFFLVGLLLMSFVQNPETKKIS